MKRKTIIIDFSSIDKIKKAEKQKSRLENAGWKLDLSASSSSRLVYLEGNEK